MRFSVGNTVTPHGIKDVKEPLSTHKEARLQGVLGFRLWIVLFGVDHIKTPCFPKVMGAVHPLLFSGELEESEHLERQLVGSWYMTQGAQPVSVTTWRVGSTWEGGGGLHRYGDS